MKTAESKTSSTASIQAKSNAAPFFSKGEQTESSFFGSEKAEAQPFFSPKTIQPKLRIGSPNDVYEQQADAVADQVVQKLSQPQPSTNNQQPITNNSGTPSVSAPSTTIQPKCDHCEQEEKLQKKEEQIGATGDELQMKPIFDSAGDPPPDDTVQRKADGGTEGGEASSDFSSQLSSSKGGGTALPADTQQKMGQTMGADFSGVRIHTGSEAAKLSDNIGAQAFTHGNDVYFNEGKYNPSSTEGSHLLAHELTHTVQQGKAIQKSIQRRTARNQYSTAAYAVGPLWNVTLSILNAPESDTESFTDFEAACMDGIRGAATALGNGAEARSRTIRVQMRFQRGFDYSTIQQQAYQRALASVLPPASPQILSPSPVTATSSSTAVTTPELSERPASTAAHTPTVYLCSKPLDTSPIGNHAFFRVGGIGVGNTTYSLQPIDTSLGAQCWQGVPDINYPSDYSATGTCIPTSISLSCLEREHAAYPIGHYCTLGPNSNTYVGQIGIACGVLHPDPPGYTPGIDAAAPTSGTYAPDKWTTLVEGCSTKRCIINPSSNSDEVPV